MTNKFSISVIGGGVVGRAVAAYYSGVKIYDKYHPVDPIEEAAAADYIFVAVPTPYEDGQSLTEMDDAIANVVSHMPDPSNQLIVIKSTALPGTTDAYQKKYPQTNFAFNPEFLTEKTAIEDFAKPDKQLVGYTDKTKEIAKNFLDILPTAPYQKIVPAAVAEMVKYAVNSYYGFKVIFANSLYDICEKIGIDYSIVSDGLIHDKRIVNSHLDVLHGGYRGYGGKCLPKDVRTLAWFAKKNKVDASFLEAIIKINDRLTGK